MYSVADKTAWSTVKDGGIVEIAGIYDYFADKSKHEVVKAQFLSFSEPTAPIEIVNATVAEFIAAEKSVTKKYRVSGTITEIQNPTYGNLKLKDDTGEVLIFGVKKDKDAANTSFSELGAEVGDKLTVVGFRDEYNGTIEMTSGYCEKLEKDTTTPRLSVSTTALTAKAGDTSASFNVNGNVKWTVSSDNAAYTVSPASGEGAGTVTVKFAANETEKDVTVKLTVSTTEEVATKSYTVVLTHSGKSAAVTGKFTSNVKWKLGANAYDATSTGNSKQSAVVNEEEVSQVLKLGKKEEVGKATLTLPAGTTKVTFYGFSWKGTKATLVASIGETKVASKELTANTGVAGNPPYKITVTSADLLTIELPSKLATDTDVEITTAAAARVVLFAINAE